MKIIVCTDIEGVGGVVSFEHQAAATGKYYEQAKRWLTAEINAAVEAMVNHGASEILVLDGHGAGGVNYEELHPAAQLFHGRPFPLLRFLQENAHRFDAAMMIGQHAMAGCERGTLNHTQDQNNIEYYTLNGKPIGEIAQWSLSMGAYGVPMIFLSGDEAACHEAEALIPGISTAAVKLGTGRTSAVSFPPAEAHRRIREGVKQALVRQKENPLAPLTWKGPFVLEKRFFHTGWLDAPLPPNAKRLDARTVQLFADDIREIIYA